MANALSSIIREAKRLRKAHPHRFDRLKNPWANGYMAEASAIYKRKHKKTPVGKKRKHVKTKHGSVTIGRKKTHRRKRTVSKKRSTKKVTKKRKRPAVKTVTRHRKKRTTRRTVSGKPRRRIGKKDNTTNLLLMGALGLGAVYLLTRNNQHQQQYPTLNTALNQTSNYTRNQQSSDIVNYAMAASLGIDAITKLINSLNSKSDAEVNQAYQQINTTGQIPYEFIA